MRYDVLGKLRVVDEDTTSFITAQKVEILLAALLTGADHIVSADQLMAELWGERLPRRASAGLHVYVSELRKFLGRRDRENPIVTRSPGYVLRRGTDTIDAEVFLKHLETGRALVREERHEEACQSLATGLALWRGPVLGGVGTGLLLRSFATRLAEARLECVEMFVDAQFELGRYRQQVGLLYSLTTENPLREAFHGRLMLALYRSDRRADALQAYQMARRTLLDELGLEPCSALRSLHDAILRADGLSLAV